jgi:hypothetical protein
MVEQTRDERFAVIGPVEMDVANAAGSVEIRLVDGPEVCVLLRHRPVGGDATDVVGASRVEMSGRKLVVHIPEYPGPREVTVDVAVHAPHGSRLSVHSGSASVAVVGSAGDLRIITGSGRVDVERSEGEGTVQTGSGRVEVGATLGALRTRTGSGDVWLGVVHDDVEVHSGSGQIAIADVVHGMINLLTGSGGIRVGVRSGVVAEVSLASASGRVRDKVSSMARRAGGRTAVQVRGQSASGDILVTATAS